VEAVLQGVDRDVDDRQVEDRRDHTDEDGKREPDKFGVERLGMRRAGARGCGGLRHDNCSSSEHCSCQNELRTQVIDHRSYLS
jgi:hypothetical protein